MTAVVHIDTPSDWDRRLPWALRMACATDDEVLITLPGSEDTRSLSLGEDKSGVGARVADVLDNLLGQDGWRPTKKSDSDESHAEDVGEDENPVKSIELRELGSRELTDELLDLVKRRGATRLVFVQDGPIEPDTDTSVRRRRLLREAPSEVVVLRPGREDHPHSGVLVGAARGPHCAAAMKLCADLGDAGHGPLQSLFIEPNIGRDAEAVGRRILARLLSRALGDRGDGAERHVIVDDVPHRGLVSAAEELHPGLLVLGSSKLGALGQRLRGTVWQRVERQTQGTPLALVRAAMPLRNRFLRRLETGLVRTVPQLQREQRLALVERVQSNSQWDFDFFALMSLSTLIAGIGLLQSAPAVVIGAMLVAPLMTPMLGTGLALAQGNPFLLRSSLRSVVLGFVTAVALGVLLGWAHPGLERPTIEMLSRGGPNFLDLVVAFVSGVAAAYASSRPSLLAALPGVAIAAALVPPITTAGLALSMGEFELFAGSSLLFLTNMVAIALAATMTLWAVGVRYVKESTRTIRWASIALIVAALGLSVHLSFVPLDGPPEGLRERLASHLAEGFVLGDVQVTGRRPVLTLAVHVRGAQWPRDGLAAELARVAAEHLGEPVRLSLAAAWLAEGR